MRQNLQINLCRNVLCFFMGGISLSCAQFESYFDQLLYDTSSSFIRVQNFWTFSRDFYENYSHDLSLFGMNSIEIRDESIDMNAFYQYYRDGDVLNAEDFLEFAHKNNVTADDIEKDFEGWVESDDYLTTRQEVEILEISHNFSTPQTLIIGGVDPVPEPVSLFYYITGLVQLLSFRRRKKQAF